MCYALTPPKGYDSKSCLYIFSNVHAKFTSSILSTKHIHDLPLKFMLFVKILAMATTQQRKNLNTKVSCEDHDTCIP